MVPGSERAPLANEKSLVRLAALLAALATLLFLATVLSMVRPSTSPMAIAVSAVGIIAGTLLAAVLFVWVRRELTRREERYRNLFQNAPVSLWREDFSLVGPEIEAIAGRDVGDLAAHLRENPEEVRRLASLIRVTDVNEAATRLVEAPSSDLLIGPLPMDTFSRGAIDAFVSQFVAIANGEEKATAELKGGLTLRGRPIEAVLVWSAPRRGGELDLSNVTVAIVDITPQREAERRLEELVASKDQFVATISHELRTPLTAVVGIAEELRDGNGSIDDAERTELLGLVAEQGHEVTRIVDDLLVVARSDAGNLVVTRQPIDLIAETESAVRAIGCDVTIAVRGKPIVFADPQRVRQIIRNLITNAQRYGGPDIRVVVSEEGARGVVEVRDNGAALPPGSRDEIFEPYARARQRPGVTASVGLGLTVSRRLARHMGGDLAYDHDGTDTTFTLTLASVHPPTPARPRPLEPADQLPAGR